MADSFKLLERTLQCAKQIDAKYYTFHGVARVKRTPITINFDRVGLYTQKIIDLCQQYGVTLAYENVHWAYYNYVGFFNELRKRVSGLKGTLDIKQARQSNLDCKDLIKEMGSDIVTVHLSDIDGNGKMCLPGKGVTDFKELFTMLNDVGFDGALLLEVYQNDFDTTNQLFESLDFISQTADKIFR
jgi:sugar phosphate isomerase/epimerase